MSVFENLETIELSNGIMIMGRSFVPTEHSEKALVEIVGVSLTTTMLYRGLREDVEASDRYIAAKIIKPYIEMTMMYEPYDREQAFKLHCKILMDVYSNYAHVMNAYGTLRRHYGSYLHKLRSMYFHAGFDNIEVDLI